MIPASKLGDDKSPVIHLEVLRDPAPRTYRGAKFSDRLRHCTFETPAYIIYPGHQETYVSPEMVEALCSLAARFQDQAELSIGELLGRSGFAVADEISDGALENYLRSHPELVNAWLIESKNTRENPAWYIFPPRDGSEWVVTHYPANSKHMFSDKFKACAFYVRVFVKQLASRQSATYYGRVPKWPGGPS